ncbi:MAG: KamA family radical SAM protein [Spirochaetota bacterium]
MNASKQQILKNRRELFNNASWQQYSFHLKQRVRAPDLHRYFQLTEQEEAGIDKTIRLNVSTTPYYLSLADPFDADCPIRKTIVPRSSETVFSPEESLDPLREEELSPVKGLTKMYNDRALLFSNQECSVYCRHCMRGRKVSYNEERMTQEDLEACFTYLHQDTDISDVVISGGDPLNLSDTRLDYILQNLQEIPHIKICRIGTRNPVTLPMRITTELCAILEARNDDRLSIFCNTQFNHAKECTPDAKQAVLRLLKAGVSVGNQCVLLQGINDTGEAMLELHRKLLEMRVRAYYMYDPELIPGSRGFRTPLYKGFEIIEYLRGKIGGMGIPQFVNDLPGGGGKITLSPDWYLGYHQKSRHHIFRSALRGSLHLSPEPEGSPYEDHYKPVSETIWQEVLQTEYWRERLGQRTVTC